MAVRIEKLYACTLAILTDIPLLSRMDEKRRRERERERETETDRQTGTGTERQTDRQTDRQTQDREQTETEIFRFRRFIDNSLLSPFRGGWSGVGRLSQTQNQTAHVHILNIMDIPPCYFENLIAICSVCHRYWHTCHESKG